jgi:hypothetical protein
MAAIGVTRLFDAPVPWSRLDAGIGAVTNAMDLKNHLARLHPDEFRHIAVRILSAIVEAPTIYHARMRLAVRGIGNSADFCEGSELDTERAAARPPR